MVMKSMKGKQSEAFGDFTKKAEMTDRRALSTYLYYWCAGSPGPTVGHNGQGTPGQGLRCLIYGGGGGSGWRFGSGLLDRFFWLGHVDSFRLRTPFQHISAHAAAYSHVDKSIPTHFFPHCGPPPCQEKHLQSPLPRLDLQPSASPSSPRFGMYALILTLLHPCQI